MDKAKSDAIRFKAGRFLLRAATRRCVMRYAVGFFVLALISSSALAAGPRDFSVNGTPLSEADVLDARALPTLSGQPDIMVTLTEGAARKVSAKSGGNAKPPKIVVMLDGSAMNASQDAAGGAAQVLQISANFKSFDEAAKLAKRISGKEPLPDSLDEDDL
jgi:hypothetical protein